MLKIKELFCEYMKEPINIDVACPRLSWTIESTGRAVLQRQYRVVVCSSPDKAVSGIGDLWDTGRIDSDESANIIYKEQQLLSDTKYWWSVKIWDEQGNESDFAAPACFETALFHMSDWKAAWIGPKSPKTSINGYENGEIRSPFLRKEINLPQKVIKAKAFFSGLGWGELSINGKKVSDSVLNPAPTDYDKTILYSTYDIIGYLNEGANAIGILLGNGWFSEYMWKEAYGACAKAMLQINLQYEDGSTAIISTDKSWKVTFGPILETRLWGGEVYDARREIDGWNCVGYDDSAWVQANIKDRSRGLMKSQLMPPVKVKETIVPEQLETGKKDVLMFDMKELFGGWSKIKFKGKAGSTVTIKYSDRITPQGEIDQHLQVSVPNLSGRAEMWKNSIDIYTLKGSADGEIYEPRFTYHPVHYVQIELNPDDVTIEEIIGEKIYQDIDLSGSFECDNELLNSIHKAVVRTLTNQMFGIPLDCLYREHWGWVDPGSLAGTLYTRQYMPLYWRKWLEDIQQAQFENGAIPDIAPNYIQWNNVDPIWGGSYPRLVWFLYLYYNDEKLLRDHYDSMKRSYEYHNLHAVDGLLTEGSYGDHMLPGFEAGQEQFISDETSPEFLWTGCHYETALILSRSAAILGKTQDAEEYAKRAEATKKAINDKWFDAENSSYDKGSQTALFYALAAGLVPDGYEEKVLERAVNDLEQKYHGNHHTGNTGTTAMIDVLGDTSRQDVLYNMVNKTSYPGWGYMIANGSSTIWESWSQISNSGCLELSMTLWTTIDEFFYNELLGIKGPDYFKQGSFAKLGFKEIVIAPYLPAGMQYARGSFKTVYGTIASGWEKRKDETVFNISVPANTSATVFLPISAAGTVTEGNTVIWSDGKPGGNQNGITKTVLAGGKLRCTAGSGDYCFIVSNE